MKLVVAQNSVVSFFYTKIFVTLIFIQKQLGKYSQLNLATQSDNGVPRDVGWLRDAGQ